MTTWNPILTGRIGQRCGCRIRVVLVGLLGVAMGVLAEPVSAGTTRVPAGGEALQAALDAAADGDVLVLEPGVHHGPVTVMRPLTLQGEAGAVLDGREQGRVITVKAPDVAVRNLVVRGSGTDRERIASGIYLDRAADRAVIEGNHLEGNLFGVYVWGPTDVLVRGNTIIGRDDLRMSDRGNGVSVWNSPGTRIVGNRIVKGRDGIFVSKTQRNRFNGNRLEGVRFGIHYMDTNDSEVSGNISVGNQVGYAIMMSNRIVVRGNLSQGDHDHAFLLHSVNGSRIAGNAVKGRFEIATAVRGDQGDQDPDVPQEAEPSDGPRIGTGKCVFVLGSVRNEFRDNWFEGCEIGAHVTGGSERNTIVGNAFVGNHTQVKYVGARVVEWSENGRGNYWSDNAAFDLNGDGIADEAYRPNDLVDRVMWAYPSAKLLLNSPGIQVIRWAQRQLPQLQKGGIVDTSPLMTPPAPAPSSRKQPGVHADAPASGSIHGSGLGRVRGGAEGRGATSGGVDP